MDKDDLQRQEEVQENNEREAVLKEYSLKADRIEKGIKQRIIKQNIRSLRKTRLRRLRKLMETV